DVTEDRRPFGQGRGGVLDEQGALAEEAPGEGHALAVAERDGGEGGGALHDLKERLLELGGLRGHARSIGGRRGGVGGLPQGRRAGPGGGGRGPASAPWCRACAGLGSSFRKLDPSLLRDPGSPARPSFAVGGRRRRRGGYRGRRKRATSASEAPVAANRPVP